MNMKKMFNKPKWLKPEINELKYWVHLVIVGGVALGILQYLKFGSMLTLENVGISVAVLAAGDIVAHTVLKLD
jgi:hypothetical protein